ncbi:serine--tRNA ligase [archaeon]|jgi:seryl-tRNA synthetase|nr:serine--tRNA ligase [archaeon]
MIDINLIRENPELVIENMKKKFQHEKVGLVDEVLKLDGKWRKLKFDEDDLRKDRNKISKEIAEAKKGKNEKLASKLMKEAKEIPEKIAKSEEKRKKLELEIKEIMYKIPNIMHESVPKGKGEEDNKELRRGGKIPKFEFIPKSHIDLVEDLEMVDTLRGSKVAGSRFYYLKADLVLLSQALQRFTMDYLMKKNYVLIQPPYMLNRDAIGGAVSLEDFEESIYKIEGEDLYLIGTSEHALAAYYSNEIINVKTPIKLAGISSCFRKEAGSHGKDTKGIYRVHRFEKIEQFVFCMPEDEKKIFNEIINNQEEIFKLLEIPYRVSALCSGEFGGSMAETHDLEGWFPSQKKYNELGSTSTATTYQARKLNIRHDTKGSKDFVYTLNGTAMTVQRTMCCLLENNQNKDGSINIPKVLQPYMGGKCTIGVPQGGASISTRPRKS